MLFEIPHKLGLRIEFASISGVLRWVNVGIALSVFVARIGVVLTLIVFVTARPVADHNRSGEIRFLTASFYFAVEVKSGKFQVQYHLTCAHVLSWKDAADCEVFDLAWSQLPFYAANNLGFTIIFDLCWVC